MDKYIDLSLKKNITKIRNISKTNTIIHCHGVFDLLHIGHIKYFEEAKSLGDILFVSITSDKFVNKGTGRPFFNQKLRCEAVSALKCVDFVTINNHENSSDLIKLMKPNIYVKGPDYQFIKDKDDKNLLLEKKAAKSVNASIRYTSGKIHSSSNLLNKNMNIFNEEQIKFISSLKKRTSFQKIKQSIDSLVNKKIMIIGETILDRYIFCDVIGKSGKEPMLVNHQLDANIFVGGILSVSNNISNFCDKIQAVTYLGNEKNNKLKFIKSKIGKNVKLNYVEKSNSPTIMKTRLVDKYTNNKLSGLYKINNDMISSKEESKIIKMIDTHIKKIDIVIIVDYSHGMLSDKIIKLLISKSKYLAVNSQLNAFNTNYYDISRYRNIDYLCIQEGELRNYFKDKKNSVNFLIKKLYKSQKIKKITVTMGKNGVLSYDGKNIYFCPAFAKNVIDRIGAGDTILAVTSMLNSLNLEQESVLFTGSLAARETVQTLGTGNILNKKNIIRSIEYSLK